MDDRVDVLAGRPARLARLRAALLAAEGDPHLEAIVRAATVRFEAPMAMASLVLDRIQFYLAHHGLPPSLGCSQATDRDVSFCQVVVRDRAPLVVGDAVADERVPRDLVKRFGVRAYLGAPMRVGVEVVGSLCVVDIRVREFREDAVEALRELAAAASARLEEVVRGERRAGLRGVLAGLEAGCEELPRSAAALRQELAETRADLMELAPVMKLLREDPEGAAQALGALRGVAGTFEGVLARLARAEQAGDRLVGMAARVGAGAPLPAASLAEVVCAAEAAVGPALEAAGGLTWDPDPMPAWALAAPAAEVVEALAGLLRGLAGLASAGAGGLVGRVVEDTAAARLEVAVPGADPGDVAEVVACLRANRDPGPLLLLEGRGNAGALVVSRPGVSSEA